MNRQDFQALVFGIAQGTAANPKWYGMPGTTPAEFAEHVMLRAKAVARRFESEFGDQDTTFPMRSEDGG